MSDFLKIMKEAQENKMLEGLKALGLKAASDIVGIEVVDLLFIYPHDNENIGTHYYKDKQGNFTKFTDEQIDMILNHIEVLKVVEKMQ